MSGVNKKHRHNFQLLNLSNLVRNPTDSLYYYVDGKLIVGAECMKCGRRLSHRTIIRTLNKFIK
jgi:hypothetical protein